MVETSRHERLNAQLAVLRLERAAGLDDSNP
jgi:hypothetical protein